MSCAVIRIRLKDKSESWFAMMSVWMSTAKFLLVARDGRRVAANRRMPGMKRSRAMLSIKTDPYEGGCK